MRPNYRGSDSSVTEDIINKIHRILSDPKSGGPMLDFLRTTEPVFMEEVHRFIRTELSRMKNHLTETQSVYVGSVIGASYLSGFLIKREADHQMFGEFMKIKERKEITIEDFDRLTDKGLEEGKTYKEIAGTVKDFLARSDPKQDKDYRSGKKKNINNKPDMEHGEHFSLGGLE
jgi:hypothetical protein